MGRCICVHQLACVVIILILHLLRVAYPLPTNVSSTLANPFCFHEESSALLQFKTTFFTDPDASSYCDDHEWDEYEGDYHVTKVHSFPKTENWKEGSDCCSWDGVSCDEVSGHVIQLDLSCSQLQGVIHSNSTLFQLRHLQRLNLAFNNFMGFPIPSEIGQLSDLTHLNVSKSGFSGEIPSEILNLSELVLLDVSGNNPDDLIHLNSFDILLQHLTKLKKLVLEGVDVSISAASKSWLARNLSSTPLSDPRLTYLSLSGANLSREVANYITSLEYLKYLDLSRCSLGKLFPGVEIKNMTRLEYPDLPWNEHEGQIPNSFANLKKLQVLRLDHNIITGGFPHSILANLSQLNHLSLSGNDLTGDIPANTSGFQLISMIDLSDNSFTGKMPYWLSQRPSLVSLNLAGNQLAGEIFPHIGGIGNLTHLEYLDLSGNELNGQIPNSFANLKKLQVLRLAYNNITGGFPNSILANLSQLNHLSLSGNGLSGDIPTNTSGFQLISVMDLSYNSFTGKMPYWLSQRSSLVSLNLAGNQLAGEIFPYIGGIGNLTHLEYLDLSGNELEGQIPNSFANLKKLQVLRLGYNYITGGFPNSILANLSQLNHLSLSRNGLTGDIPANTSGFQLISVMDLSYNSFTGKMPYWLSQLPSLVSLNLTSNQLAGEIFPHIGEFQSNQLQDIDLRGNNLQGANFSFISNLVNLIQLSLASNNLTASLECNVFVGLQKLQLVDLSDNNHILVPLCDKLVDSPMPNLSEFLMSNCSASAFPFFLRNLVQLERLDLSYNEIRGPIPEWLRGMGRSSLQFLDLSHNFLTTSFEILPWDNLQEVDFRFNSLQGVLPIPSMCTSTYLISNNMLSGKVPPRICDLNSLQFVDFANNNLSGSFPNCLFNMSPIDTLILRRNNFSGTIPEMVGGVLSTLDLSHNKLEGHIPRSLVNHTDLEILDLGHNSFFDTFPGWLETLPQLKILILQSNNFYGSLAEPRNASSFTELSVIDLSHNNFSGNLPSSYFHRWKSMMTAADGNGSLYVEDGAYYKMTLTNKGQEMNYTRILTIFKAIDFSNNKFVGEIPQSIGNLTSLVVLNLSYNGLTGDIPPSLANLVNLNSLDISNNRLFGRIPQQLNSLTALGVFNVSQNNLEGPIPQTGQLSTFPYNSYEGNPRLCGIIPLNKTCEEVQVPSFDEQNKDSDSILEGFTWKPVVIGYGCGALIGIVLGNFIIKKHEEWVMSFFNIRLLWRMKISSKVERK